MKQIQRSTLENAPFPCFRLRLTVVVFPFQWKCQVSLSIASKTSHLLITNDCSFVNESTAFANGLVSIQEDGTVIMKADNTSNLASGVFRDRCVCLYFLCVFLLDSKKATLFALSVRIVSQTAYNTGLFVLDLNTAPWGCGTSHIHSRLIGATYLDASVIKAVWPAFWTVGANWPTVRAANFFVILLNLYLRTEK
jgi:hypothetical protein